MKILKGKMKRFSILMLVALFVFSIMQTTTAKAAQKQTTFVGDGYEVTFSVVSSWPGAFNGQVTITNTTDKVFHNWGLKFDMKHEITNVWNGTISKHEGTTYVVRNALWNQDIAAHGSVSFGFSAKADADIELPDVFKLLGTEVLVDAQDVEFTFNVVSDWGSAFNGEIRIKNVSDKVIEDWKLSFDFDRQIDRFWTASIVEQSGNHYLIQNLGYNANIQPGQTIVLGFSGHQGNVSSTITNYVLTQIVHDVVPNNDDTTNPEEPEPEEPNPVDPSPVDPNPTNPNPWGPGYQDPEEY